MERPIGLVLQTVSPSKLWSDGLEAHKRSDATSLSARKTGLVSAKVRNLEPATVSEQSFIFCSSMMLNTGTNDD